MALKDLETAAAELASASVLLELRKLAAEAIVDRRPALKAIGKLAHRAFCERKAFATDELSALLATLQSIRASASSRTTPPPSDDATGAP